MRRVARFARAEDLTDMTHSSLPQAHRSCFFPQRQRGAAALVVVMVLFFIISLVAAYTGRNLIFEQRTSTNLYRATQAFEAADAGMQWALAQLNSGRIGGDCKPTVDVAKTSFRDRYLNVDGASGNIGVRFQAGGGGLWPSCVFNGADWQCDCPSDAAPTLVVPGGAGAFPAFRVRFVQFGFPAAAPSRPGLVRIEVNGCTQADNACLNFRPADSLQCRGTICAQVALSSGLKSAPLAAITARGSVNVGGAAMSVVNSAPGTSGITIHSGLATNRTSLVLQGAPGTPSDNSVVDNELALADPLFTPGRMFAASFGVWRETYWQQPGAVTLTCLPDCSAAMVRAAISLNPGRAILVPGNLALEGGGDVGSATQPVVIVVTGNVTFTAPTNVYGLVYSEAATWASAGTGLIQGAVVAQGNFGGSGSPTVVYDKTILDTLHWRTGSFVMVPGSWKDFP